MGAPPTVTIAEGKLQGKKSKNYLGEPFFSFLGIPYAEPPIGDLRFKAPIPKKPWEGVRKAAKQGPPCPSPHMLFQYYVGCEADCLNLNVFTKELPETSNNSLKPVMVWIHGGAFVLGCNQLYLYGPEYLMIEDIVLVVINYRLGVLGFLCLEDPSLGVPGNAGMKDMVLALKWVQKNISEFSGNPKNVTIFGESAGGAAVHYLCISPMAKGLFHKAIAQSGCVLNPWALGYSNGKLFAKILGYEEREEAKILQYLRQLPAKKIVNALRKNVALRASEPLAYAPVVEVPSNEPAFLLEQPVDILKKGTFNKVPMIMGYNSEEGIMFYLFCRIQKGVAKDIPHHLKLKEGTTKEVATRIEDFYLDGEEITKKNILKLIRLKTDTMFVHGIHRSINYQKNTSNSPIYLYRMTLETSLNFGKNLATSKCILCNVLCLIIAYICGCRNFYLFLSKLIASAKVEGVSHGDDLSYLFKSFFSPKLKRNSMEEISVRRFVKLWANFARTGNPTPAKTDLIDVAWPPVNSQHNYFLEIGKELTVGSDPDWERVKFWDSLYANFTN